LMSVSAKSLICTWVAAASSRAAITSSLELVVTSSLVTSLVPS